MSGCHSPLKNGQPCCTGCGVSIDECKCIYDNFRQLYQITCKNYIELNDKYEALLDKYNVLKDKADMKNSDYFRHEDRINDLEESYQGLSAELKYCMDKLGGKERSPRICRVCSPGVLNEAIVQAHLILKPNEPFVCPGCNGKGIVWG